MRVVPLPLLMLMVLLSPLAIDIYLPSMPTMAEEFSVSSQQVQSTLILFLFAMGLGQILIGPMADKFGRRPVALAGVVLYTFSSVVAAFAEQFVWLQLMRVAQGFAACSASIVVFSAVRDCYSGKKSAHMYSYLNGAICVIPALAPMLGGLLAEIWGWRSNFIFMAGYGALMLVVIATMLPETRPENTDTSAPLYRWGRYQPIVGEQQFWLFAGACMVGMAAILAYVSYSPIWLIDHLGLSPLMFSLLFGGNALINIIACFTAPKLISRLGELPAIKLALTMKIIAGILTIFLFVMGPAFGIDSGMGAALAFMLPMMLLCIGFSILLGPATALALAPFGERAGTAAAMVGCLQMSGAALFTALMQLTPLSAPLAVAILMILPPVLILGCLRAYLASAEISHG